MFRKQIRFGLLAESPQAEAHAQMAIAFGVRAFRFEWASIAGSGFIMFDFDPVAILGFLMSGVAISQALVGGADELILFFIVGEILGAKDGFADEVGFAVFCCSRWRELYLT